ncbi:putative glucuronosyltransferase PGSIP8 [Trifolium repens]|nr:putative glucuronosyltransferase PGSIP8 [Trifolium repens]
MTKTSPNSDFPSCSIFMSLSSSFTFTSWSSPSILCYAQLYNSKQLVKTKSVDNILQILEEKLPFVEIIEDLPQSLPKTSTKWSTTEGI